MFAAYRQHHYYSRHNNGSQDPLTVLSVHETLAEAEDAATAAAVDAMPEDGIYRLGNNEASTPSYGAAELADSERLAKMKGLEWGSEKWAAWCDTEDAGWLSDADRYEYLIVGDEFCAATEYGVPLIAS